MHGTGTGHRQIEWNSTHCFMVVMPPALIQQLLATLYSHDHLPVSRIYWLWELQACQVTRIVRVIHAYGLFHTFTP